MPATTKTLNLLLSEAASALSLAQDNDDKAVRESALRRAEKAISEAFDLAVTIDNGLEQLRRKVR